MSGGKHPTATGPDAQTWVRAQEPGTGPRPTLSADDDPPSGVILRRDVRSSVPRLAVTTADLKVLPLDHRAGFIVSFVDGKFTVEMILDACAMPRAEALAILGELVASGIVLVD